MNIEGLHTQRSEWRERKMKQKGIKILTAAMLLAWHNVAWPCSFVYAIGGRLYCLDWLLGG